MHPRPGVCSPVRWPAPSVRTVGQRDPVCWGSHDGVRAVGKYLSTCLRGGRRRRSAFAILPLKHLSDVPTRVIFVGMIDLPLREVELFAMEAHQPFPLVKQPNLIYCEREKDSGRVDPFVGLGTIEPTGLA